MRIYLALRNLPICPIITLSPNMAQTNVWAPVGSPGSNFDYTTNQHSMPHDPYGPPSPTPSNQSRNRFTAWFSRSRSGSPANANSRSRSRSRSKSPNTQNGPSSPSSFVVRNVVKQSGGVSWDPAQDGSPNLEYKRSKSRPLGVGATSLGVPPGGPGGGTGYGTALSSNDGRPEPRESLPPMPHARPMSGSEQRRADDQQQAFQPPSRPVSPGHTKAAAFQRPRSQKSPSPAPNSQRERQQQHRFSVSPGPQSWRQQHPEAEILDNPPQPAFAQEHTGGRPVHTFPASIAGQPQYGQQGVAPQQNGHLSHSPQHSSPLSAGPPPSHGTPVDRIPGFDPSQFRPSDSQGSLGPTPSMPSSKRQSIDARAAGFGFMGGHEAANANGNKRLSSSGPPAGETSDAGHSPGFASRIRGFFNTPTRNGTRPDGDDSDEDELNIGTPYGVSQNAYQKAQSGSAKRPVDPEDHQAEVLRQRSHREAVRLIDQEREAAMGRPVQQTSLAVPSLPSGIARELAAEGWTPEALQRMTEDGRQNLVRRLTANGKVSREASLKAAQQPEPEVEVDWDNLTPAQRIIAETRSRQIQRERAEDEQARRAAAQASAPPPVPAERGKPTQDESMEIPVRRATRSPKKDQNMAKFPSRGEAPVVATPPRAQVASPPAQPQPPANAPKVGLSPGTGPMPNELGLMGGLQEMMTRFYRYERYSVPLLRALEMRLIDIERDAQMAHNHPSGDNASDRTGRTSREKEMDKWVGQMTSLMRHEIGQLKAATKEIREGREMLGVIAKSQTGSGSRFLAGQTAPSQESLPPGQPVARQLTLPPGAAPALDKDEGKAAHGQQVSVDVDPSRRARSTSPNGRPKYTNALGMPLADGRKSPERASTPVSAPAPAPAPAPLSDGQGSFSIEAQDVTEDSDDDGEDDVIVPISQARERSLVPDQEMSAFNARQQQVAPSQVPSRADAISPPLSDVGSTTSSSTSRRRDVSVNERLKKLVSSTTSSRSSTPATVANNRSDADADASPGFARSTSPQALVRSVESEVERNGPSSPADLRVIPSHVREGSSKSHASSLTVTPSRAATGGATLAPPSPIDTRVRATTPLRGSTAPLSSTPASPSAGLIGGRTSPSPSSYAGNSPSGTGSGFRPSVGRQGSTSPGVPHVNRENIKTSTNASSGLRARAQSYLLSADGGSSAPGSPSPSSHHVASSPTKEMHHTATPPLTINKQKSSYFTSSADANSNKNPVSAQLSRERTRSSPAPKTNASPTNSRFGTAASSKLGGAAANTAGMTLKERVAFFEVSANK